MIEKSRNYSNIRAYSGIGSDIKWCGQWNGGKYCLYCKHHSKFEEWSTTWHWHYLLSWYETDKFRRYPWYFVQSHYSYSEGYPMRSPYHPRVYNESPRRYYTVGLKEKDIKALLRRGCRRKRKCKCINIAQRGSWCCPKCYLLLNKLAQHNKLDIHDILISDRNDLKENILTLLLSGTL